MSLVNHRPNSLTRLLSQLRGLVSLQDTEVNRRDLTCARHSEVQLELDLKPQNQIARWSSSMPKLSNAALGK
jgi:hypothetical protein